MTDLYIRDMESLTHFICSVKCQNKHIHTNYSQSYLLARKYFVFDQSQQHAAAMNAQRNYD